MYARVLLLLVAGVLTMGAVAAPPVGYIAPDRAAATAELGLLTAAVVAPDAARTVHAVIASDHALAAASPSPARVAGWWTALAPAGRAMLERVAPVVVGGLEGLPYPVRDRANRRVLTGLLASARTALARGAGKGEALLLGDRLRTLEQVATALRPASGGPQRYLVTLDPVDGSRAAVAVGDPQTATSVDLLVPGMFFTVADQMVDWTNTAAAVQREQAAWNTRLHRRGTAAVVAWIGYRTPDAITVFSLGAARDGAVRLADAVNGLRAARGADAPFVGVLAHSYGATAALLALQAHAFRADALAMVGTPGSPATSVRQLAVPAGQVFVGRAELDSVATSGFFGSDPAAPGYGATDLGASGGVDPITFRTLGPAVGHNGYFAAGTESLRNLALVGIGRGADVTSGRAATGGVLALAR